jgi:hypothetical protein
MQYLSIDQTKPGTESFEISTNPDLSVEKDWVPASSKLMAGLEHGSTTNTVVITPKTREVFDGVAVAGVTGVRYTWQEVPEGRFLYDYTGLPAGPFIARCNATGCALINPGEAPTAPTPAPKPTPPTPPKPTPAPPTPPPPPSDKCDFHNHTTVEGGDFYKNVQVPLYDTKACCGACRADAKCAAAQVHHGGGSANYCYCYLFTAKEAAGGYVNKSISGNEMDTTCVPLK